MMSRPRVARFLVARRNSKIVVVLQFCRIMSGGSGPLLVEKISRFYLFLLSVQVDRILCAVASALKYYFWKLNCLIFVNLSDVLHHHSLHSYKIVVLRFPEQSFKLKTTVVRALVVKLKLTASQTARANKMMFRRKIAGERPTSAQGLLER